MADLLAAGYTYLRTTGPVSELEVELRDDAGTAVLRIDGSDPRLTITDDAATARSTFVLVLSGDDPEVVAAGLPLTVASAVLYSPAGTAVSAVETYTDFVLGSADDELTVSTAVQFPAA